MVSELGSLLDALLWMTVILAPGFATGFLFLLIKVVDDPDYDADPGLLTLITFLWPLTLPLFLFVAVPVTVWVIMARRRPTIRVDDPDPYFSSPEHDLSSRW